MHQAVVKGGQREFNIAMIDALNAPVVESIQAENYQGHADDQIIIRAKDDFKVVAGWNVPAPISISYGCNKTQP